MPSWAEESDWLDAVGLSGDCPKHAIARIFCMEIGCNRLGCVAFEPVDIEPDVASNWPPFSPVRFQCMKSISIRLIYILANKFDGLPCNSCCCSPTACICCKNCKDDVDKASAPMNGFIVWGGLVISDEFDVNAVAFGIVKPFACTENLKLSKDVRYIHIP